MSVYLHSECRSVVSARCVGCGAELDNPVGPRQPCVFSVLSLVIFPCFSLVTVFLHKSRTSHATLSAPVSMPRAKLWRVVSGQWMSRGEPSIIAAFSSDPFYPGVGPVLACLRCGGGSSLLPLLSPLSRMK